MEDQSKQPDTTPANKPPVDEQLQPAKRPLKPLLVIAALFIVIIGGGVALTVQKNSSFNKSPAKQSSFSVAGNPYVYACGAFNRDVVATAFDFNKDKAEISQEAAVNITGSNSVTDLLSITGEDNSYSQCNYNVLSDDDKKDLNTITVTAYQYKDHDAAVQAVTKLKPPKDSKPLPSFDAKESPSYSTVTTQYNQKGETQPLGLVSVISGNTEFLIRTRLSKTINESEYYKKLDTAAKQAVTRFKDGQAYSVPSYTSPKVQNASVNACKGIDVAKLGSALEGADFNFTKVQTTRQYDTTPDQAGFSGIQATCLLPFRTQADKQAEEGKTFKPVNDPLTGGTLSAFAQKFPQTFNVRQTAYPDSSSASLSFSQMKVANVLPNADGSKRPPLTNVKNLGDKAVKAHIVNKQGGTSDVYTVISGAYKYEMVITSKTQTAAFTSQGVKVTDDMARQAFNVVKS